MKREAALAASLILSAALISADETAPLLQEAVAAYRDGRPFEALEKLGAIVEAEPDNALAKNYIWTITRNIQKQDAELSVSDGVRKEAVALAESDLAARRGRTQQILDEMRSAERKSGDLRSPGDILQGMRGANKFLGGELEGDLARAQAKSYVDRIVANLTRALEKNVFVSRKEHLTAEGYRAYLNGDMSGAVKAWEAGLKEDPSDRGLAKELEDLEALIARRGREERIGELEYQAKVHYKSGDYVEALAAWKEVLVLDPQRSGVADQAAAARAALERSRLRVKLKEGVDRGVALYKAGDDLGAAQVWLDVLREDPSQEDARNWLEHVSRRLKTLPAEKESPPVPAKGEKAVSPSAVRQAAALEDYKRGIMHYAQGGLEDAVQDWKSALEKDPDLSRAREALRQAQMELNLR